MLGGPPFRRGEVELEQLLERVDEAIEKALLGQANRGLIGQRAAQFAAHLRRQGFRPTQHFAQQFLQEALARGIRFDPCTFRSAFYRARHYRQTRPGYNTRIAVVHGIPVRYYMDGESNNRIVLMGGLRGALPPIAPPRRSERDAGGEQEQLIPPWRLVTRAITAPREGTTYRGITRSLRRWAREVYARQLAAINRERARRGLPALPATPIHVGHITPHVFARPGETIRVRPEEATINLADAPVIRAQAAARRRANLPGLYVRGI
jgi:hypothetical protein